MRRLVRAEEPHLVLDDRAAEGEARLVPRCARLPDSVTYSALFESVSDVRSVFGLVSAPADEHVVASPGRCPRS